MTINGIDTLPLPFLRIFAEPRSREESVAFRITLGFALILVFALVVAFRFEVEITFLALTLVLDLIVFFDTVFRPLVTCFLFVATFLTGLTGWTSLALTNFFAFARDDEEALGPDLERDFDFEATVVTLPLSFVFVLVLLESDSLI